MEELRQTQARSGCPSYTRHVGRPALSKLAPASSRGRLLRALAPARAHSGTGRVGMQKNWSPKKGEAPIDVSVELCTHGGTGTRA